MKTKIFLFLYHRSNLGVRVDNVVQEALGYAGRVLFFYWQRDKRQVLKGVSRVLSGEKFEVVPVYMPFYRNRILFLLAAVFFWLKLFIKVQKVNFEIVYISHLMFLPLAVFLGKLKNAKVIYDSYEFSAYDLWFRLPPFFKWIAYIVRKLELILVRNVDTILTVSSRNDFWARQYRRRNPHTYVIYNLPCRDSRPRGDNRRGAHRKKRIVYVGGIEKEKGGEVALASFLRVKEVEPEAEMVFIGMFQRSFQNFFDYFVKVHNLQGAVFCKEWMSYQDLLDYLSSGYVGIALYQPYWRHYLVSWSNARKIFTYMDAGLPVVVPNFGEIASVVREEKCGVLIDSSDPDKVAKAILYLFSYPEKAEKMAERGRHALRKRIQTSKLQFILGEIFSKLVEEPVR